MIALPVVVVLLGGTALFDAAQDRAQSDAEARVECLFGRSEQLLAPARGVSSLA